MNPFGNTDDDLSESSSGEDCATVVMEDDSNKDDLSDSESSEESELRKLQQKYNDEENKINEENDEKAAHVSQLNNPDSSSTKVSSQPPSTDLNPNISLEAQPSNTKYQNQYQSAQTNNNSNNHTNDPSFSPFPKEQTLVIADDYNPSEQSTNNNDINTRNKGNSTFIPYNSSNIKEAPVFAGNIDKVDLSQYDPQNSNAKAFGVDIFKDNDNKSNMDNDKNNNNDNKYDQPQTEYIPMVTTTTVSTAQKPKTPKQNEYKPYIASTKTTDRKQKRYSAPPNKPIPAIPQNTNNSDTNKTDKIITFSNMPEPLKWVNFIAQVKSHQTKQIWQTYNYNQKGYELDANLVINRLDSTDKTQENGTLMIDGDKVFVFERNLRCKFPFKMVLRTNTNNELDGNLILQKIVKQTNDAIQELNIHDIGTFDYSLHFDNTVNKLRSLPKYNPSFYTK